MAESAILTNTTIAQYIRGFVDSTIRGRIFLAYLQKKAHILYNQSGLAINWRTMTIEPPVTPYTDGATIDYASYDCYKAAELEWRSVKATDKLTEWQKEINKGKEAIINIKSEIVDRLMNAVKNAFGNLLFLDGNAAGNERSPHGLNSLFGTPGTTVVGDLIAKPAATYAGISTAVGVADSTWTAAGTAPNANIATDWPNPRGNSGYDYWSPKDWNWSSTAWGTGTNSWEDNCVRVIRKAHHCSKMLAGPEGQMDVLLLDPGLYTSYCNKFDARMRIMQPAPKLLEMGFDGVKQEGCEIADDFDCPVNTGFGINFDELFLRSLKPDLFYMEPKPVKDPHSDAWLYLVKFFGNLQIRTPKAVFRLKNTASA